MRKKEKTVTPIPIITNSLYMDERIPAWRPKYEHIHQAVIHERPKPQPSYKDRIMARMEHRANGTSSILRNRGEGR